MSSDDEIVERLMTALLDEGSQIESEGGQVTNNDVISAAIHLMVAQSLGCDEGQGTIFLADVTRHLGEQMRKLRDVDCAGGVQ